MAIKHRCPSCGDLTLQIADQEFRSKGVIILWRICESCGHKWREVYNLSLFQTLPWTRPPHNDGKGFLFEKTLTEQDANRVELSTASTTNRDVLRGLLEDRLDKVGDVIQNTEFDG